MRYLLSAVLLSISGLAIAAPTIYDTTINWDDTAARTALLATANTPQWEMSAINKLYDVYQHPQQHQLPTNTNVLKYNTEFLDAYWGPLTNPFVSVARPAKAFVYLGEQEIKRSFMAPIVKNAADGNFYVFNRANNKPQLLDEWMNDIKSHSPSMPIKFTICNGYGNLPTDTCEGKSYQAEQHYALLSNTQQQDALFKSATKRSVSAYRAEGEDWRSHLAKSTAFNGEPVKNDTILENSISWKDLAERNKLLQTTATWANYKVIQANFEKLRDLRYFNDKKQDGFLRRLSWLYPDDGCWTRASAVINHLFGAVDNVNNPFVRPSKIFAFGNLCVNTSNHKKGRVRWWYHTAPIIRDVETQQVYVLDPSVNPSKPMTVEEWMNTISANTGACKGEKLASIEKFNVCTHFGVLPFDRCANQTYVVEAMDALDQNEFQAFERKRQIELGRDADKVLGDQPPWM